MSNFNVSIVGTANVTQMSGAFGKLQSQVTALNAQLAQMVALQNGVDPAGYERMTRAAAANSQAFRNAAASTGMFEVQQLKVNRATETFTDLLQKQKLSFRDLARQRKLANAAYKEQLAMQNMVVRQSAGGAAHGKNLLDVIYPREANAELNRMGNQIGWIREQTRSAATQMVNWGKNTQWAGRQLMVGFTMPVAAFGAATGVLAYQVDKQLTRIQKVYDTTADANNTSVEGMIALNKELDDVRKASLATAETAARQYGAAATDTLDVQAELAATGQRGAELQNATNEVMRIAVLGEMEHADAIKSTIALQSVFRMNTDELTKSFNYMNAVENATSLQLKDFAAAIPIAAAPIKQMGGDIYELGVLLTAMRERGIEATQGANAIKAAMQRLYRPSKQIREEFAALTGADITQIVENADNLTEILQGIGRETEGMSKNDATKVYAGLFGSYQVTRMSAMVEGVQELEQGIGQVSDAARLAGEDSQEWADAADREMKRMQDSISGRFKIALETVKVQLAQMGEPFVVVATKVLQGVSMIIDAFNALPKAFKYLIAGAVGLAALAGPAIMLAGLFGNLTGNALKMGVALMGLFTRFELVNKETRAASLAAQLASQGYISQRTHAQQLTAELGRLALAQATANRMSMGSAAGGGTGAMYAAGLPWTTQKDLIGKDVTNGKTGALVGETEKAKRNWKAIGASAAFTAASVAMIADDGKGASATFTSMAANGIMVASALSLVGGPLANATKNAGGLSSALGLVSRSFGPIGIAVAGITGAWILVRNSMERVRESQIKINDSAKGWAKHLGYAYQGYKNIEAAQNNINPSSTSLANQAAQWAKDNQAIVAAMQRRTNAAARMTFAMNEYEKMRATGASEKQALKGVNLLYIATSDNVYQATRRMIAFEKQASKMEGLDDAKRKVKALNLAVETLLDDQKADFKPFDASKGTWLGGFEFMSDNISEGLDAIFRDAEDDAEEGGKGVANRFADSLAGTKGVFAKGKLFKDFENDVLGTRWKNMFKGMEDTAKASLKKIGVTTGEELRNLAIDLDTMSDGQIMRKYNLDLGQTIQLRNSLKGQGQKLLALERGATKELKHQLKLEGHALYLRDLETKESRKSLGSTKAEAKARYDANVSHISQFRYLSEEEKLSILNTERKNLGLEKTNNLADMFGPITRDGNNAVKDGNDKIEERNKKLTRTQQLMQAITKDQIVDAAKTAMSDFQQGIADATMNRFTTSMDRAMERVSANAEAQQAALEARQESASEQLEARQEAAQRAMQNRQERATAELENRQERTTRMQDRRHEQQQEAIDRRWERRNERVTDAFDARIKKVNDAIAAEEKAEAVRQRIFDAEMTRLDRLNESENRNIDFNVALNEGNFDEAAKIRNDMEAAATGWALEDANTAGATASERRRERLEGRIDIIEDNRDQRIDAMEDVEEAERKALERRQEREKRFLDRRLEREKKALERRQEREQRYLENRQEQEKKFFEQQQEAEKKRLDLSLERTENNERRKWEKRQRYLEKSLDDFTGYIATSTKDLRAHIRIWEREHKGLSLYTQGRFATTSKNINENIVNSVTRARREMTNGNEWEISGRKIAADMVNGAFGMNLNQFRRWIVTGKTPKDWDMPTKTTKGTGAFTPANVASRQDRMDRQMGGFSEIRHQGGEIGGPGSSRAGTPRTAPIRKNEVPVLAERGEYMVNKYAAKNNRAILEGINSGKNYDAHMGGKSGTGGLGMGFAGIMGAMMQAALKSSVQYAAVKAGHARIRKDQAAAAGAGKFSAGKAGQYGDRAFSKGQLKNAAIIANVGRRLGMSPREIQIGIMTAITESGLVNVNYGDRDSLGLFQQRPSMGWGTPAQVTDPEYAAGKFFRTLKGVGNRDQLAPWLAAQAVQRSFDETGANYRQYWDNAQAIFDRMGRSKARSLPGGPGGWHLPISGKRVGNSHAPGAGTDIGVAQGTPVRAVYDGKVITSKDIYGNQNGGYASYGRYIMLKHDLNNGTHYSLYAHLRNRLAQTVGQNVRGGTVIGKSGNTGNSTGPHLHFEIGPGTRANSAAYPGSFLSKRGLPALKEGAHTLSDGLAMLHRGETVLTADLSQQLMDGIGRFATGGASTYNVHVNVPNPNASADDIARVVMQTIKRAEARKPQSRRG